MPIKKKFLRKYGIFSSVYSLCEVYSKLELKRRPINHNTIMVFSVTICLTLTHGACNRLQTRTVTIGKPPYGSAGFWHTTIQPWTYCDFSLSSEDFTLYTPIEVMV